MESDKTKKSRVREVRDKPQTEVSANKLLTSKAPNYRQPHDYKAEEQPKVSKLTQEQREILRRYEREAQLLPEAEIDQVALQLFDNNDIAKSIAVCEVNSLEQEGSNTLNDPLMGITTKSGICATCFRDYINCPGHFGYIKLPFPVYNPLFASLAAKVLSSVCPTCASMYLTQEQLEKEGISETSLNTRLEAIAAKSKGLPCTRHQGPGQLDKKCGSSGITFKYDKDLREIVYECKGKDISKVREEDEDDTSAVSSSEKKKGRGSKTKVAEPKSKKASEKILKISDAKKILDSISNETAALLGFQLGQHPRNFIIDNLLVLPPVARPSTLISDGKISQDFFTTQYKKILTKINEINKQDDGSRSIQDKENLRKDLFTEIQKLFIGDDAVEGILGGKEGIIRKNIMGRRVNFAARTVLNPGPNLRLFQVGISRSLASALAQKEIVCAVNYQKLKAMWDSDVALIRSKRDFSNRVNISDIDNQRKITMLIPGSGPYEGRVFNDFDFLIFKVNYKLQLGDTIYRKLQDGDRVIFNRQPTLHRLSIMGFQVVIHDDLTHRLPLPIVSNLNADFDGDESNAHAVHDFTAISELDFVMNVKNCMINPQKNAPSVAPYYDALTGVYVLTGDDIVFTETSETKKNKLKYEELQEQANQINQLSKPIKDKADQTFFIPLKKDLLKLQQNASENFQNVVQRLIEKIDKSKVNTDSFKDILETLSSIISVAQETISDLDKKDLTKSSTLTSFFNDYSELQEIIKSYRQKEASLSDIKNEIEKIVVFQNNILNVIQPYIGKAKEFIGELLRLEKELKPILDKLQIVENYLETSLTTQDFYGLLNNLVNPIDVIDLKQRANKYGVPFYTGKILFSATLPRDLTYENGDVKIKQGILISGRISAKNTGKTHNSLVQVIYKNYGVDATADYIDNVTFITNDFLARRGFTVGYEDCEVPEALVEKRKSILDKQYNLAQSAAHKMMKSTGSAIEDQRRENQLNDKINTTRNVGTQLIDMLPPSNKFKIMAESGAKGNVSNTAQILGSLGQQYDRGERFKPTLSGNSRCLYFYEPNSTDIASRGFCRNNFMTGLDVDEFFFHMAGGRLGLIDTAMRTGDVGDTHRKLVKFLEDFEVVNDGSVRFTDGSILQFIYGEDGFEPGELQFVNTPYGNVASFIDVDADVKSINTKFGF